MGISDALVLDSVIVLVCGILLFRYGELSAAHPGVMYLVFHILVFTTRMYAISSGAPTLFTDFARGAWPIAEDEIVRAGNLADIGLASTTVAFIKAARDDRCYSHRYIASANSSTLSATMVWVVCAITFPVGLIAIFLFAAVPTR